MVRRTERRAANLGIDVDARVADARSLPFADDSFDDAVVLHLVLAVVPEPRRVVAEVARVPRSRRARVGIRQVSVGGRRPVGPPAHAQPGRTRPVLRPEPTARTLLTDSGLAVETRTSVLGGLYTTAIVRPTAER